ncbi:3-deoxy-D-manno-octulosonic-acid transferase [Candidatus Magnetoovum chiemensis]|nr:3-deoxy-D-manno-octulosonic-acid transferase [Candidatus Magnetoovum chiemensis]
MKRFLYNSITSIIFFLLLPFLPFIYIFSSKRRANMLERLGWIHLISKKYSKSNHEINSYKKRIWLHALSVGEIKSALPLVNAIKERYLSNSNYELVITASTKTGFDVAKHLFLTPFETNNQSNHNAKSVQVGYFPFDLPFSVKSICSRIDPDLVIIVESDLWPQFLWYMNDKRIPVFLVNARLSQSSFNGYMALRKINLFSSIFSLFEKIMVQTDIDKERFLQIGVPEKKIIVAGNIKFDQPIPKIDIPDLDKFKNNTAINNDAKIYIVAGSTHEGEEDILASIFIELKQKIQLQQNPITNSFSCSDIKLIIAPRDPKRAPDINKMLNTKGFECSLLNDKERDIYESDIVVIDKMGILSALYSICDIAFVGGSLVPCGGHNPLEPALFSKPVIFGTYTDDFKEITETMLSHNAAFRVKDKNELCDNIFMLLNDKALAVRVGQNGYNLVIDGRGAVDRVLSIIKRLSVTSP